MSGKELFVAKKSLLLVDADSKSLRMLEVSLRKSGFSVTTAIHAADAREKLKHATPDLVITDTKLPGDENGFDFVRNLKGKAETATLPVIFLSSENRLEQKVAGLELGVEDYLTKPIYIKEVLTRVRVLLDKREKQTLERRERSSSFAGLIGDMGLVDLMQTVEIGRKTGHLAIETRDQRGTVSFREGKVCDARSGRLTGERAFYRMLVWNDGTFSMEFGPHDGPDVIELSTQGLLMEGMRRVDEWGRLIEQLPPLDHRFEIDFNELVERLSEIPDEINILLRLFDGHRTLLEVVDETDFGDLEALEIASKLYFEGLIFDTTGMEPAADAGARVEAWLQEPASTPGIDDVGVTDDVADDHMLVPNDTMPPQAAESTPPEPAPLRAGRGAPVSGGILAPPSGASHLSSSGPHDSDDEEDEEDDEDAKAEQTEQAEQAGGERKAKNQDENRQQLNPEVAADLSPAPEVDANAGEANDAAVGKIAAPDNDVAPAAEVADDIAATILEPARPLPQLGDDEPETRSVMPRSAVGATAWSSAQPPPSADDAEDWEDIVAPEEDATPTDSQLRTLPAGGPAKPAAVVDTAADDDEQPTSSAAAAALAQDLGLSHDELALALAAEAGIPSPSPSAPPTIIDDAPHAEPEDLAASIAAQLDSGALHAAEGPNDDDDEATKDANDLDEDATDAGGRRLGLGPLNENSSESPSLNTPIDLKHPARGTPPPAPLTALPSRLASAGNDTMPAEEASGHDASSPGSPAHTDASNEDGREAGDGDDENENENENENDTPEGIATVPAPRRGHASGRSNDGDEIHTRRTQLDLEPLPIIDRFGLSRPVAAGIFVGAFLLLLLVVSQRNSCGGTAARPDAGPEDSLVVSAPKPVVDAGAGDDGDGEEGVDSGVPPLETLPVEKLPDEGVEKPPAQKPRDAGVEKPPVQKLPDEGVEKPPVQKLPDVEKPVDDDALYARHLKSAEGLARRGDFGKSVRAYKAAIAVNPNGAAAHLGLGNAYYELDSLKAALFHLEKARSLTPKDPQAYVLLGAAYQSARKVDDAIKAYERYLELAPNGKFARDIRGILRGLKSQ